MKVPEKWQSTSQTTLRGYSTNAQSERNLGTRSSVTMRQSNNNMIVAQQTGKTFHAPMANQPAASSKLLGGLVNRYESNTGFKNIHSNFDTRDTKSRSIHIHRKSAMNPLKGRQTEPMIFGNDRVNSAQINHFGTSGMPLLYDSLRENDNSYATTTIAEKVRAQSSNGNRGVLKRNTTQATATK